ncbi:MAG: hypothetical protein VKJ46_01335, partial [Leptolyngbyaceae bacterium]|nr:hypothetical protein [Leptolyngbyaceae bacterium]
MSQRSRPWTRLLALAIGSMVLAVLSTSVVHAADPPTLESVNNALTANTARLQRSIDTTWILVTGFLVFFMQTGFALLETGLLRQTSAVNALLENFIDAAITCLVWWAVGFGIAFGTSSGGFIGTDNFFLSEAIRFSNATTVIGGPAIFSDTPVIYSMGAGGSTAPLNTFTLFFFQFAFAATASTITTGAMAERTDFIGDLI